MKKWKRTLFASILGTSLAMGSIGIGYGQEHIVQYGDTFWKLSQKYNVSMDALMDVNRANQNTILYPGQKITIPTNSIEGKVHTVQAGETYWIISQKYGIGLQELLQYNGANQNTILYIGQQVKIPPIKTKQEIASSKPYVTYINHTVQKGEDPWKLSLQYGIPMNEILEVNHLSANSVLNIGDVLKIPVHHVPVKPTPGSQYGEYLDWWTEAQYVMPIGSRFTVLDFYTGKRWNMKRTIGANHADCEPLTKTDTAIMKQVWGGNFSWNRRPVIIEYRGRKIAASAASQPHDVQHITDNNFEGHMDIHFANSTRHKDGKIDWEHQENVKIAAGKK